MAAEPNYTTIRRMDLRKLQQRLAWDAQTWSWPVYFSVNPSTGHIKINFDADLHVHWRPAPVILELQPTGLVFAAVGKHNRGTFLAWLIEDMRKRPPATNYRSAAALVQYFMSRAPALTRRQAPSYGR